MTSNIPVITIDGTGGSGKGTISLLLAQKLGWHFLDSGVLYRVLALSAEKHGVANDDQAQLVTLCHHLNVQFHHPDGLDIIIKLEGDDVTEAVRAETCGNAASIIGVLPDVRTALVGRQKAFRQAPGLVTDGRDMGTVIFPDANVKFYFKASQEERAQRRQKQLQKQGIDVSLRGLLEEIVARDDRDMNRAVAPLKPATDAIIIDTSGQSVQEVYSDVLQHVAKHLFN